MTSKRKSPQKPKPADALAFKRDIQKHAVELAEIISTVLRGDLAFVLVLGTKPGAVEQGNVCVSGLDSDDTAHLLAAALKQIEGEPAKGQPPGSTRH